MIGSRAPQQNAYEFLTAEEEAPSGMIARGTYNVRSVLTDDDEDIHYELDWCLKISKDWE